MALDLLERHGSALRPGHVASAWLRLRTIDHLSIIAAQRGTRTIIVSSHNLHEIETVCDHVALIDRGRVVMAHVVAEWMGLLTSPLSPR